MLVILPHFHWFSHKILENVTPQENPDIPETLPPASGLCHTGSQCDLKPHGKSFAVQVRPKMVSVGTQTTCIRTSTPLASPDNSDEEASFIRSDTSWVPDEEDMSSDEEASYEEPSNSDLNGPDKYIVCKDQLMGLFTICPVCCSESNGRMVQQGDTFIKIKQV